MNILFAASEAYPFIKTGGLGDVMFSLPEALNQLGDDARLVLPAYRDVMAIVDSLEELGYWDLPGVEVTHRVRLLEAKQESFNNRLYLIDVPALFDRPGNPYVQPDGHNWPDNAERFTVFSRAVSQMAKDIPGTDWVPDVVHCNDWQTGLVPAFISMAYPRPRTVFTIHNLAYDGHYSYREFEDLSLPPEWWSSEYVEFYDGISMLKAGIVFADKVTTVSPTYAKEICTPEFGYRFEGLLQSLGDKLSGILNGIDLDAWDPETDTWLHQNYSLRRDGERWYARKQENKKYLLRKTGLRGENKFLLGFIGRLVEQKGIDLVAEMLPALLDRSDVLMIVLGSGESRYERQLTELASRYPEQLYVHIGYSEELSHQVEAGCDMFLMPSRFEPCGLNQMYSLRYGTPPLVNFTGGLADTVIDATDEAIRDHMANGFVIHEISSQALLSAVIRAYVLYRKPKLWRQLCEKGMTMELGWSGSASRYQELYTA